MEPCLTLQGEWIILRSSDEDTTMNFAAFCLFYLSVWHQVYLISIEIKLTVIIDVDVPFKGLFDCVNVNELFKSAGKII